MPDETVTLTAGQEPHSRSLTDQPPLGLVIALSTGEPHRIGETILLPMSRTCLIGRGSSRSDDPHPRALIARLRPGVQETMPPLRSRWISRRQLVATARFAQVEVKNVGRAEMRVNGIPAKQATLKADDVVEIGDGLVLICAPSPVNLPQQAADHDFGTPDAAGIVGESLAVWRLRGTLAALAPRRSHVLVLGESGTGKELVARALHSDGPLIARSAATLPEGLIDAELFGNAESYPQAGMAARPGLIGAASGGCLFLDEIAELPEAMQARLLRVLDHGEYHRLGESRARRSDFRLIAATNRPLTALKSDVLARLPVRLQVPPLSERRSDIPLLVRHLLQRLAADEADIAARFCPDGQPAISAPLMRALLTGSYPDNIRGLLSALWTAILASPGEQLEQTASHRAESWQAYTDTPPAEVPPEAIQACLDAHNGNQEQTWQALGFPNRHTLGRLIRKHGLVIRRSH